MKSEKEVELALERMKLEDKYGETEVLVINSNFFLGFSKFVKLKEDNIYNFIFNKMGVFIKRYDAELTFDYRQIIPYCLIKCQDNYYITHRLEGDAGLVGQYSLGIGGHIEKIDGVDGDYINAGMLREINEEIDIKSYIYSTELIALVVSNDTDVDKRHVGLFYVIELDGFNVQVKETEILAGEWISKEDLLTTDKNLESWSKIFVENFIK